MASSRLAGCLCVALALASLLIAATGPAKAVLLQPDNQFVLDFVANGDGSTSLSNLEVAVYWRWDGGTTLGIRMETPNTSVGFGNLWSFNVFNNGMSPGGLDSNGSNNTVNVVSAGAAFSAASLGAFATAVDAIEGSWTQPSFDPLQSAVYIQLTMLGPGGPGDGYRMAEYLADGGTYANAPDILATDPTGFCATTNGSCALLTFGAVSVPEPATFGSFVLGLAALGFFAWRRRGSRA